jgi:5-methylcytosine-specific restriction protein A
MTRPSGWQRSRKPSASAKVTQTWKWKQVRKRVMERDGHECQVRGSKCTIDAYAVDKIIPAHVDPDLALDMENLRAVCGNCHNQITARQASAAAAEARRRRSPKRRPRVHPSDVLSDPTVDGGGHR